jgi:hypothetical protein
MEQLSIPRGDGFGLNLLPNGDIVNENGDFIKKDGVYLDSPQFNNEIIPFENGNIVGEDEAYDQYFISSMNSKYKSPEVDNFDVAGNKSEPITQADSFDVAGNKSEPILDQVGNVAKNVVETVGKSFFDQQQSNAEATEDTLKGIIKGSVRGVGEAMKATAELVGIPFDTMNKYVVNPIAELLGFEKNDDVFMGSESNLKALDMYVNTVNDIIPVGIADPTNQYLNEPFNYETYGNIVEEVAKFGITAVPAAKIVGMMSSANAIVRGFAWGGIADYMSMNPEDPAIATFLVDYFETDREKLEPWARNAISVLEKHDTDGVITKRLKNMMEGTIAGGLAEGILPLVKGIIKATSIVPWAKTVTPLVGGAGVTFSEDAEGSFFGSVIKGAAKNADLGIKFSPEIGENNLRLHLKRIAEAKEKGIKYPGSPKNQRTVITNSDKTMPDIVVGDITFDDWKNRVEFLMNKEEILKASKWYGEVFTQFEKVSGGNETEMKKLGEAWLSAQQNETPSSALTNVLSIFEQFKRGVPIENIKGKGLPSANKIATDIIYGNEVTGGAGQKIADFIDSGHGKDVRSIMNNNSDGGAPFVVDVHTGRDTGLVDQEFINHLNRLGYDVPENLIKDHAGGGIKGTMYENRALFGQELTENLNSINWLGKSDWKPMEIQAIGWMNLTKMTGQLGTSGDVASAFSRNTRRISMEVDPGEGSPWSMKYGKDYNDLADASKFEINNKVTAKAIELVNKKEGLNLTTTVHGTGGWELYQNPSTVSQAISSRETAIKAAARLGYMLNQTEVWVNTSKEITQGVKNYGIDIVENGTVNLRDSKTLISLFESIVDVDAEDIFKGYQPIIVNGQPGIRIIIKGESITAAKKINKKFTKAKAQEYIMSFANNELNKIFEKLNFNVEVDITEVELTILKNNWKDNPDGKGFKSYLGDETRAVEKSGGGSDLDIDGKELEDYFSKLLKEARGSKTAD